MNFSWRFNLKTKKKSSTVLVVVVTPTHQCESTRRNFFYDFRDLKFYVQMGASLSSTFSWKAIKCQTLLHLILSSFFFFCTIHKKQLFFAIKKILRASCRTEEKKASKNKHEPCTLDIVCELSSANTQNKILKRGKCLQSVMAFLTNFYNCTRLSLTAAGSKSQRRKFRINKQAQRWLG